MSLEFESAAETLVSRHQPPGWARRHGVWLTGAALLVPESIGSVFNIAYNVVHVETLLTPDQHALFLRTVAIYNLLVYPVATVVWIAVFTSLQRPFKQLLAGETVDLERLTAARRRVIDLPWWGVGVGGIGWFLCIPVFLTVLSTSPEPLDPQLYGHLPISLLISALIATTHGFFILELFGQSLLYPVFFRDSQPANTPGAHPLSLRSRGVLWAVSAGVCPIGSLLLLALAPGTPTEAVPWFALSVGGIGIAFGLTTAWLVGRWVTEPVDELKRAAGAVAAGDFETRIHLLRADDFGPLIDEFNHMVTELRAKEHLQETFGRHVGEQAAQWLLERDPGLGGVEEVVTVMFVDIRNFTARSAACTPQQVVSLLNRFLTEMVDVVETGHGGMVNKFLGDGFMALFGGSIGRRDHADAAVAAGQEMLRGLESLNQRLAAEGHPPLEIGIGIHTGPAIVGSIGSPRRMEYTAIGDTVNVASRVEGLTKAVGEPLLFTVATRAALQSTMGTEELPPQRIKGHAAPLAVCRVGTPPEAPRLFVAESLSEPRP